MKKSLRVKYNVILILIGVLIYLSTVSIGTYQHYKSIVESYNERAYQAAQMVDKMYSDEQAQEWAKLTYDYVHGDATEEDAAAVTSDPAYMQILDLTADLRDSINANDIFVFTVDRQVLDSFTEEAHANQTWRPMLYIADNYRNPEMNYLFGQAGVVLPEYIDIMREVCDTGVHPSEYIISKGKFGFNISAMQPMTVSGRTVAIVGVEIPMTTLFGDLRKFIIFISLVALLATAVLLVLGSAFFNRSVISPIRLVSREAEDFIKNDNKISEKLKEIKTGDEIQSLSESLLKMEIGINEYIDNLTKVTAEKERIGAELNIATQIQADMLPRIFPPYPDRKEFDLYATMAPAKEVGGDFYDFFLIDDNHIALVMADVSGKGVPAALFMVIAKTLIKNRAQMGGTPGEILHDVNEQLCEGNESELFVTVWLAIVEISTGKGIAANAGHEHPAIMRAGGGFDLSIYRHSLVVGVMEGAKYADHEFELHPGDCLFVYTDGVAEATDSSNELYGTDRMLEALNREPDASPDKIIANVNEGINEFVKESEQFDDITMLCFRYFG
ncbi:MAG: PP2C family protein-serine/threonine phosphatase [Lachnospiraceae bacterium]|nr:PP2C family protein-serine/threonine phosphatase [Lachnospiraceae bacterium]